MSLLYQTRAQRAEEIFRRFDAGERPSALIKGNVAASNVVYKYYRLWLVLQLQHELNKTLAARNVKKLSVKKLEKFLEDLRSRK